MVKSVIREFKWSPTVINELFIDDADYLGLEYWYNDALEIQKSINKKKQ